MINQVLSGNGHKESRCEVEKEAEGRGSIKIQGKVKRTKDRSRKMNIYNVCIIYHKHIISVFSNVKEHPAALVAQFRKSQKYLCFLKSACFFFNFETQILNRFIDALLHCG